MRFLKYSVLLMLWTLVIWPISSIIYMLAMKLPHTFIPFSPILGFIVLTKPEAWDEIFNIHTDIFVYITLPFLFFWFVTALLIMFLYRWSGRKPDIT